MARLTSFTDSEPAEPRPDYALEVRGLKLNPLSWEVGAFREGVLQGKIELKVGGPRVEIFGESGSTSYAMRLRQYYPSLMDSRPFRSVPMMEISAELGSKPLAAYWLHDHPLPVRTDRAAHQFRLLPQDYSPHPRTRHGWQLAGARSYGVARFRLGTRSSLGDRTGGRTRSA